MEEERATAREREGRGRGQKERERDKERERMAEKERKVVKRERDKEEVSGWLELTTYTSLPDFCNVCIPAYCIGTVYCILYYCSV